MHPLLLEQIGQLARALNLHGLQFRRCDSEYVEDSRRDLPGLHAIVNLPSVEAWRAHQQRHMAIIVRNAAVLRQLGAASVDDTVLDYDNEVRRAGVGCWIAIDLLQFVAIEDRLDAEGRYGGPQIVECRLECRRRAL